jgi:hypothetical protein
MGDLKTPYTDGAMDQSFDPAGQLPTARGNDPNIDMGGASGLKDFWSQDQVMEGVPGEATANSVSALPQNPQRFQPSETPPAPPDLTDRNPGTIDQR